MGSYADGLAPGRELLCPRNCHLLDFVAFGAVYQRA